MIQSASYLVCFGKREKKKRERKNERKKREKKVREKKERKKKKVREKKEKKKQNSDLFRLNLVVEFGLESVLCTVQ